MTTTTLQPPQGIYYEHDIETNDMVVNIGPQHPSTHGVLRLITTLDGEVVKDMEPVIGYLHRSKEKMGESRALYQYQPTIDRVEYLSSFYDHYCFVSNVEKIAQMDVPKRVQYIRMITMELNRITSHLLWFGTFLLDLGATSPMFYAFRDREKVFKLFEDLTGARMMYNYYRFGGVIADLPEGWLDKVRGFLDDFPHRLDEYEAIVNGNPIFLDRTMGVGVVDAATLIQYGVTGPSLRASGVALDQRKTNPYCCYDEIDFEVPVFYNGDVLDRYKVRIAEMRESLKIIRQAVDKIPGGDTADLNQRRAAGDEDALNNPDYQIFGKKINLITFKPPKGEAFTMVESPRGFMGCYLITDGTPKAYRVKWRGASFSNLTILPKLMKGLLFPDLMAIFGSLDVILPEVDR